MANKKECPFCGTVLVFHFAKCDYSCPKCTSNYSEHEINEYYGAGKYGKN